MLGKMSFAVCHDVFSTEIGLNSDEAPELFADCKGL
jgi:hypothetical protein